MQHKVYGLVEQTLPAARDARSALHRRARGAGALYAVVVATGTFGLGFAPDRIFAGETPEALVAGIADQQALLGMAIIAEVACYVAFGLLALALFELLRDVHAGAAAAMGMLVVISVPFGLANVTALVEIHRLAHSGELAASPGAVVALHERYLAGLFVQSVPWGLWLLPFGYLVIRSGFLPWLLGVGLILAGAGYLAHFAARLLIEGYRESVWPPVFASPRIAEILTAFWLLLCGARRTLWPGRRRTPDQTRELAP